MVLILLFPLFRFLNPFKKLDYNDQTNEKLRLLIREDRTFFENIASNTPRNSKKMYNSLQNGGIDHKIDDASYQEFNDGYNKCKTKC